MSLPNSVRDTFLGSSVSDAYEITASLKFDEDRSQYLERTFGTATSSTTQTWSFWVKTGWKPYQDGTYHCILCNASNQTIWRYTNASGSGNYEDLIQSGVFNGWSTRVPHVDPTGWKHVMIVYDTTNGTAIDRLRHYYNGVNFPKQNGSDPGSSANIGFGQSGVHNIGRQVSGGEYFEGYIAEFHMVDGQALDPTAFGKFNASGVWVPKEYTGTYGNNGFYLKFDNPSNIGADSSGNGNNWTGYNFNFATADGEFIKDTYSNRNHTGVYAGAAFKGTTDGPASSGQNSGQFGDPWNWNPQDSGSNYSYSSSVEMMGGEPGGHDYARINGSGSTQLHPSSWRTVKSGSGTIDTVYVFDNRGYGSTIVRGIRVDGKILTDKIRPTGSDTTDSPTNNYAVMNPLYRGSSVAQANLYSGNTTARPTIFGISGVNPSIRGFTWNGTESQWTSFSEVSWDFGQKNPDAVQVCTNELPNVSIKDPSQYWGILTYTGNTGSQTITGLNFTPDFAWIKCRSVSTNHSVFDSVRGTPNRLRPDLTEPESTSGDGFNSFTSGGIVLDSTGSGGDNNTSGRTYVAWCFKKDATAGFDIVTYTGNGGTNRNISHSLGAAPEFVIVFNRDSTANRFVQHQNFSTRTEYGYLNDSGTPYEGPSGVSVFEPGTFNSSTFSVNHGSTESANANGDRYVAYLWRGIDGYSKFGSYVGNGDNDGPMVYTGFRPGFIIIKRENAGANWPMLDAVRNTYNPADRWLLTDTNTTEQTTSPDLDVDFLCNGFKIRNNATNANISGSTYVYAAWAEHPFGGGNVAPAPAR